VDFERTLPNAENVGSLTAQDLTREATAIPSPAHNILDRHPSLASPTMTALVSSRRRYPSYWILSAAVSRSESVPPSCDLPAGIVSRRGEALAHFGVPQLRRRWLRRLLQRRLRTHAGGSRALRPQWLLKPVPSLPGAEILDPPLARLARQN